MLDPRPREKTNLASSVDKRSGISELPLLMISSAAAIVDGKWWPFPPFSGPRNLYFRIEQSKDHRVIR